MTLTPTILRTLYHRQGKTLYDIADRFHCSVNKVRDSMIKYGIPRRAQNNHKQEQLPINDIFSEDNFEVLLLCHYIQKTNGRFFGSAFSRLLGMFK